MEISVDKWSEVGQNLLFSFVAASDTWLSLGHDSSHNHIKDKYCRFLKTKHKFCIKLN